MWDWNSLTAHEIIGEVDISLGRLLESVGEELELPFVELSKKDKKGNLKGGAGSVRLTATLKANPPKVCAQCRTRHSC